MTDVRSNEELTHATAHGLRWVTLGRLGTELLLLATMVVLARLIPPAAFGMFAIAVIVQELAVNVPSEGVGASLVQLKKLDREHLEGGVALGLVSGFILCVAGLIVSFTLVKLIFGLETAQLVALTMPWFFFGAILALPLAILRRRLDFRRLAMLALTQNLVRSVTSVFLATVFGLDAYALVLGGLAGMTAMVVLAVCFVRPPFPRWRPQAIRDLLPYGGPAALATFCWAGFRNGDYAIVGARLGPAQAGYYWRGFQLAVEYQTKISSMMTQMAFPVLARTAGHDEMFELRRRMVRLLTVVAFPLLVSLVVLAPTVIPWLFGETWEPAVLPTQILAGAGAATVVIDAVGSVLMAAGRARALLGYGVSHFGVYVGAVLVASRWGLAGVSIAAVSVHLVFLVVAYKMLLHGRPERTLPFLWADISAAVVSCAALAAVAVPLSAALGSAGVAAPIHIAIVGAASAAAYLVALRLAFPSSFRDLGTLLARVIPIRSLRPAARRVPVPAGRSS